MPQARAAALKAIELDDTLAEGHSALGMVKLYYDTTGTRRHASSGAPSN